MTPDHRELNVRVIEQSHLAAGKHVDRRGEKQRGVSGFIKDPDILLHRVNVFWKSELIKLEK